LPYQLPRSDHIGASRVVRGAEKVASQAIAFSRLDVEVRPAS
jgi:hypothetical protein